MTDLQTAIAKIRAKCKQVLEASEKATKGPWFAEDSPHRLSEQSYAFVTSVEEETGHILFDTANRGYKESGIAQDMHDDAGKWHDVRGLPDMEMAALSRSFSPASAKLLLVLCDETTFDCYDMCPSRGGDACECGGTVQTHGSN